MSEIITAENIDLVIQKNLEIRDEVSACVASMRTDPHFIKEMPVPQLGIWILQEYGLIQIPVEDRYWSGAVYVRDGKQIPVINTALPRANQYFTAWHELYHLLFDNVSFDHVIGNETMLEERKAESFAAAILLSGADRYFTGLSGMDFLSRVFHCMSAFQVPYKAVLISLYEHAVQSENAALQAEIKEVFDTHIPDLPERFRALGLDDSLVMPSNVVNTSYLQKKISSRKEEDPELSYHAENERYLNTVMAAVRMMRKNRS